MCQGLATLLTIGFCTIIGDIHTMKKAKSYFIMKIVLIQGLPNMGLGTPPGGRGHALQMLFLGNFLVPFTLLSRVLCVMVDKLFVFRVIFLKCKSDSVLYETSSGAMLSTALRICCPVQPSDLSPIHPSSLTFLYSTTTLTFTIY